MRAWLWGVRHPAVRGSRLGAQRGGHQHSGAVPSKEGHSVRQRGGVGGRVARSRHEKPRDGDVRVRNGAQGEQDRGRRLKE